MSQDILFVHGKQENFCHRTSLSELGSIKQTVCILCYCARDVHVPVASHRRIIHLFCLFYPEMHVQMVMYTKDVHKASLLKRMRTRLIPCPHHNFKARAFFF